MIEPSQLLSATLLWLPSDGHDLQERVAIVEAIAVVTSNDLDRALLAVIATEESSFDPRIRTCRKTGDHGRSLGPWQTYASSPAQRRAICTDLVTAARVALRRVHQSREVCRYEPARWRGAAYASGRCSSRVGRAIAARRWARAHAAIEAAKEES